MKYSPPSEAVTQLVVKPDAFLETKGPLPSTQELDTIIPILHETNPVYIIIFYSAYTLKLTSHLHLDVPNCLSLPCFQTIIL
jgi:hypothetical protein